jgi:YjbE family integral membrane protein
MGLEDLMHYVDMISALLIVDVLLSGDNAMVIALACRALPAQQRRRAMMMGTAGAIVLRIVLTAVAGLLLLVPLLKIVGGVLLLVIAIKLMLIEEGDPDETAAAPSDLWAAVGTVMVADLIMSLDNVVGLAAVAHGDVWMLTLGLLISMPLLMFGSLFVNRLLQAYPWLVPCGAAVLGWIGGDIAMSDALIADWVQHQSPGLSVVVPALMAVYVVAQSRIIQRRAPALASLRRQLDSAGAREPAATTTTAAATAVANNGPDTVQTQPPQPLAEPGRPPATAAAAVTTPAPLSQDLATWRRWLGLSWVQALLGLCVATTAVSTAVHFWMPQPAQPRQFSCAGSQTRLEFREGLSRVRLGFGSAYAYATLKPDGALEWGNYRTVSLALGLEPPTRLLQKDAQTVVIDGGTFASTECRAVNPP